MMKYMTTLDINNFCKDPKNAVEMNMAAYEGMIESAAQKILESSTEKPVVLLSGPSGSGKTTTALRIEEHLRKSGHPTHTISMDNYYYRQEGIPLPMDDEGQIDLESPMCIDIALLQEHLDKLAHCAPISMPTFDFTNQRRSDITIPVERKPGEIIVVEGIHALNKDVVGQNAQQWATGVYISVRTRVRDENGYVLHPSKIRLMRRLIRDKRTRGQSYSETIGRLRSVNRGERLYIMPHKSRADIELDTFCPYEIAVYRDILLPQLMEIDPEYMEDCDVSDILPMLGQVKPMKSGGIPREELVREFIGEGLIG